MATAEEYSQGILDQESQPIEAPSYEAETREINAPTDTVAGQLDSLLDKNNSYMQRAATKGAQYSNSRGMLNSSLGAQAAQAAAIDAALPIASQDASGYLTQGLANQDATNKAGGINAELESKANISNAANQTALKEKALSNLSAQELQEKADTAALERTQIGEQGALERAQLGEAGATARNDANIIANKVLNNQKIASDDRARFTTYYDSRGRYQLGELARLAEHPDLTEAEKASRIAEINASYLADIELVSDLFAVPLDMA